MKRKATKKVTRRRKTKKSSKLKVFGAQLLLFVVLVWGWMLIENATWKILNRFNVTNPTVLVNYR